MTRYDTHNLVKYAQLTVLEYVMVILLLAALLLESYVGLALGLFGFALFKGMRGFHFLWFAVSNLRRTFK